MINETALDLRRCETCGKGVRASMHHNNGAVAFLGTGHTTMPSGKELTSCYACIGEFDNQRMARQTRMLLYLGESDEVTNWPGSLRFRAYVSKGGHNMTGVRYDAWFTDRHGNRWHGVQYGNQTCALHCRKLKPKQKSR